MEQVYDDTLWKTLEKLKSEGKIRYYGVALGPAIGWLYEGLNCIRERDLTSVQHIYNMLEQHPGRAFHDAATEAGKDTMFLIRVTHSSGMLEGNYTAETQISANRSSKSSSAQLAPEWDQESRPIAVPRKFRADIGSGGVAMVAGGDRVASTLPNIYNQEQLVEFATSPDTPHR